MLFRINLNYVELYIILLFYKDILKCLWFFLKRFFYIFKLGCLVCRCFDRLSYYKWFKSKYIWLDILPYPREYMRYCLHPVHTLHNIILCGSYNTIYAVWHYTTPHIILIFRTVNCLVIRHCFSGDVINYYAYSTRMELSS